MAQTVQAHAAVDMSSDEEGQIQEDMLPHLARSSLVPVQADNPFLASDSKPNIQSTAARHQQHNNPEAAAVPGFIFVKRHPAASTLSTLLSSYESSPPVEMQPVFAQTPTPPNPSVSNDAMSTQRRPVLFPLPKKTIVKVEEQLPSFTNWKRRQAEAQYSRPPTRAARENRLKSWTPPAATDFSLVLPKGDYYPARGPVSHYSPPREFAHTGAAGDYYRPQSSGTSELHSSPSPEADQRLSPISEPLPQQHELQSTPNLEPANRAQYRPGSFTMLPRFSQVRKGQAECDLQNTIPSEFKFLPGKRATSLWIGVVRYKKYLIGSTYTQFDKYFGPRYATYDAAGIGRLIRDELTNQIPIGLNGWLSSDQRVGVMVEQQLMQIQELERKAARVKDNERPLKRRRQEVATTSTSVTDARILRGNAIVFGPKNANLTRQDSQSTDVQVALDAVKEQVARIAQVNGWDNPHAAAVWGQVISEDLKKATESLQAALKKNGSV